MGCFTEKVEELAKNGWLTKDFDKDKFIKEIANLEFTSPKQGDVFNAFSLFKPSETRILIIGQDPYPDPNRADGLAFSFGKRNQAEDSLLNIFKAIAKYRENMDIKENNKICDWKTNLEKWAKNNKVLLLNTALTYKDKEKHFSYWESFIQEIIKKFINSANENKLVIFLWGKRAQCIFYNTIREMGKFEPEKSYLMRKMILMTSHPSNNGGAVNLGFSEDAPIHFKACDEFLGKNKKGKYTWKNFPEDNQ